GCTPLIGGTPLVHATTAQGEEAGSIRFHEPICLALLLDRKRRVRVRNNGAELCRGEEQHDESSRQRLVKSPTERFHRAFIPRLCLGNGGPYSPLARSRNTIIDG